ncbi:conserved protein of unknown function [Tenacibaculum soleae]|uniref:Piwi domain-containing protein n=1 Tax=Tenacibaculum soleae TaxID=447689 RepID=UPI003AB7CDE2
MKEHLKTNVLTFSWPKKIPTFYFTKDELEESHPIHKSKFSRQILKAFNDVNISGLDQIYTTFTLKTSNSIGVKIDLTDYKELSIYKQFLKHQIRNYCKEQGFIVTKNFVRNIQVWLPAAKEVSNEYTLYYKFAFKLQFAKLTELPELIISYDGTSKVLKTSVQDIEDSEDIKKCIYKNKVFNYQTKPDTPEKEEFFNQIDFSKTYPIFNLQLAKQLNLTLEEEVNRPKNKYQTYTKLINKFANKYLFTNEFKDIIPIKKEEFINVPLNRINHIDANVGLLEFGKDSYGNKKTHLVPKQAMNFLTPYRRPDKPNIKIFFICHTTHKDFVKDFYLNFMKGVNSDKKYYKGFEEYVNVKASSSKEHFIEFTNLNKPLPEIIEKLETFNFNHDTTKYAAFYISPFDKYTPNIEDKEIYTNIKELFLKEGIVTQVVDYQKMVSNIKNQYTFQFSLQNMALALHAKLGGKPWKLAITDKKELVIGVGAYTNQSENTQYIASAFSFQNNGLFRNFEYFSKSQSKLLAGSILKAIRNFTSIAQADKVVIHFYKEMKYEEVKPIIEGMNKLNLKIPLYILNINKTESQDIIAYDLNWDGKLMPLSGTYIRIALNQFLLFNNVRYPNSKYYSDAEGYPFPIKISISSPDKDAFEDADIVLELLTQVYQFSRLYWKSLRQQNVPITIKYPEMVAQLAPRFHGTIPEHAKDKLWFL